MREEQAVLDTRMFEAARYILSFDMMDLDHAVRSTLSRVRSWY